MVVADAVGWLLGDSGRMTLGIAFLAVVLYYRKALGLGSVLQTWAGRLAFSAGVIGIALVIGIIPGINVDLAVRLAEQVLAVGGDIVAELREAIGV